MMLGWPCGNEEHMLKNDKDGDLRKGWLHIFLSSFQSLPAWKVASTGPHRDSSSPVGVGSGAVDPQAFSSSVHLKKLWSSLGMEVSTQPSQDSELPLALSSTNTARPGGLNNSSAQWSLPQSFLPTTEESSRNVLRDGRGLVGHGAQFSFPPSIVPPQLSALYQPLWPLLWPSHTRLLSGRFFPRLFCWLIHSFFRSQRKQDIFCPCSDNIWCLSW